MTRNMKNRNPTERELFRDAEKKEELGNPKGAFHIHLTGAKLGYDMCQLALGNFYSAGRGVKRNLLEAARWYKRVYRNGKPAGALNLAVNLENQGNLRNAVVWLKRAIAMNDGDSHLRLARIYLKRRNGTKKAADLLTMAISLSPSDISDEAREKAKALLKHINKTSQSAGGAGSH